MHDAASNLTALDTTLCEGDSQPVCVFTLTVEAQRVHDDDREVHSVLTVDPDASDRIYVVFFADLPDGRVLFPGALGLRLCLLSGNAGYTEQKAHVSASRVVSPSAGTALLHALSPSQPCSNPLHPAV